MLIAWWSFNATWLSLQIVMRSPITQDPLLLSAALIASCSKYIHISSGCKLSEASKVAPGVVLMVYVIPEPQKKESWATHAEAIIAFFLLILMWYFKIIINFILPSILRGLGIQHPICSILHSSKLTIGRPPGQKALNWILQLIRSKLKHFFHRHSRRMASGPYGIFHP